MSKVKIEGNASGTGTLTIAAPNTNTDRTLTLPDGAGEILTDATGLTSSSNISQQAAQNTVAFQANQPSSQSISANALTVVQYGTEELDSHGYYDTSTYRFTPQVAGWYWVSASTRLNGDTDFDIYDVRIEKNSVTVLSESVVQRRYNSCRCSGLVYCNGSTDYVTASIYLNTAMSLRDNGKENVFNGFLVRAD